MGPEDRRGGRGSADDELEGRDLLVGRPQGAEVRPGAGTEQSPAAATSSQPGAHVENIREILETVRATAAKIDALEAASGSDPENEKGDALARETAALANERTALARETVALTGAKTARENGADRRENGADRRENGAGRRESGAGRRESGAVSGAKSSPRLAREGGGARRAVGGEGVVRSQRAVPGCRRAEEGECGARHVRRGSAQAGK